MSFLDMAMTGATDWTPRSVHAVSLHLQWLFVKLSMSFVGTDRSSEDDEDDAEEEESRQVSLLRRFWNVAFGWARRNDRCVLMLSLRSRAAAITGGIRESADWETGKDRVNGGSDLSFGVKSTLHSWAQMPRVPGRHTATLYLVLRKKESTQEPRCKRSL